MESTPRSVDELKELAELLASARRVIADLVPPMQRGGECGRVFRECGVKAAELADLAQRYEDRYTASLTG